MTKGKIVEGVFALNKPTGISSAQALRDLQSHFNPSELFAPWMAMQRSAQGRESHNQRRRRRQQDVRVKIGHGGTLDPLATGVLIAGIGKGTKVLHDFLTCTKTYETIVLFGASTDTYDRDGKILKKGPYQHLNREIVEKALEQYRGTFMQLPPLYSALKMDGKPLYEYAREGKEIPRQIQKREVTVHELELLEWFEGGTHKHQMPAEEAGKPERELAEKLWQVEREQDTKDDVINSAGKKRRLEETPAELISENPALRRKTEQLEEDGSVIAEGLEAAGGPTADNRSTETEKTSSVDAGPPAAKIRMTATSGFYVRSLCHDLGQALGSQALMAELIRTRQGQFELGKNVLEYEELAKGEETWGPQVERMLDEWSGQYRPFAGSTVESNVQETNVEDNLADTRDAVDEKDDK
ncbi:MAG: hypothetical protein M1818_006861 [Claussenomyces sp. TS43310]|nr:MAG: hypothetical protein M1818_006861 [Claussenomyces sp. TS43310]